MKLLIVIAAAMLLIKTTHPLAQENGDYEQAYQAYEQGKIDKSYIFLKNSLQQRPNHLPSKILMGQVLALSGIYDDARLTFEEALYDGADVNLVLESYVRVLLIQNRYEDILTLEYKQLTADKLGFLLSAKANAMEFRGNIEQAGAFYKQAVIEGSSNISVINSAANFYLKRGDIQDAFALIQKSLALAPNVAETHLLLASYHNINNDEAHKLKALENGLAISPKHPLLLRDLVTAYADQGEFLKAKETLERTLALSPNDAMAKLLLSWIAANLNDDELSKNILDDLVSSLSLLDKDNLGDNTGLLMVSALANLAANNLELARSQFEQYIKKNPSSFQAIKLLAGIYKQEGNFVAAANLYEKNSAIVETDVNLVAELCSLYIKANQNYKCNSLLERTQSKFSHLDTYIEAQSSLLSARGKLNLALENLDRIEQSNQATTAHKALIAIRANNFSQAQKHVTALLEADSVNPDFLNLQAAIYKKQNLTEEAEELYREIIALMPEHFAASFNLASLLYAKSRSAEASRISRRLVERRPVDPDLLMLHGRILTQNGNYEEALDALTKATSLRRNNIEAIESLAYLYIKIQDYKTALDRANELLKSDVTSAKYLRMRSNLHFVLGNKEDAQRDLRIIYGAVSNKPFELYKLALDQNIIGDFEGALRSLQQAMKYEPDDFFILRDLAKTAIMLKLNDLAKTSVDKLISIKPNNPDVLVLRADLFMINNNPAQAAIYYNAAINKANRLVQALIGSYKLANEGIGVELFLRTFETLAQAPSVNIFAVHLLADYYFNHDQFEKAKTYYIAISPDITYPALPMVLNNLALVYVTEDKLDSAYNYAYQSFELLPNDPNILDTLGWISTLQGKYVLGLDLLRKSFSMNAQNPDLRYHLAYTLFKLNRIAESKRELGVLLHNFSDFDSHEDALVLQIELASN